VSQIVLRVPNVVLMLYLSNGLTRLLVLEVISFVSLFAFLAYSKFKRDSESTQPEVVSIV
jgi:hypothetical protein